MNKLNYEKQPRYLLPKVLSGFATVACLFIVLTIIFTNDESSSNIPNETKPLEETIEMKETKPTEQSFYEDLKIGDTLNNWTLQSKGANVAVFTGEETISGRSYSEGYQWYFEIDENSMDQLPFLEGTKAILTFERETDSETVAKFQKGLPNKITVQQLVVTLEDGEATYLASQFNIENIRIAYVNLNEQNKIDSIYNQFSNDISNTEILKDLTPIDILTLYLYAQEQEDYKTQFGLYNHDNNVEKNFSSLDEYVEEAKKNKSNALQSFKENALLEVIKDEHSAYITFFYDEEGPYSFGLNKTKEGTWAVNWMPIQ